MKIFSIIILCLFLGITHSIHAQSLSGTVTDKDNEYLSYINVVLYQAKDSLFVTGVVSNSKGGFTINNIKQGYYRLAISGIGYQTYQTELHVQDNQSLDMGKIVLTQQNITLNEIIVTAKQNPLSVDQGKFKLNVSKSGLKEQASSFDVLSFLPGVMLSNNDISVIGKGKPLILLNGREIRSLAELEVLHPNQIKEVSIDNHPSAQYSSQYNSVILITTIGALKDYVSSQLFHTSTFSRKYSDREGANINILHKKWAHYLSYQIKDYRAKEMAVNKYQLYDDSSHELTSDNRSDNQGTGHSATHNIIMSSSYKFNDKNNINLQYSLDINNTNNRANTDEVTSLTDQTITHITSQKIKNKSQLHNIEAMFVHKGEKDESLSLSGGYIYSKDHLSNLVNTDKTLFNNIDGANNYNIATLKADYKRNIFGDYELQMGGKFVNTRNSGNSNSSNPTDNSVFYNNKTLLKDGTLAGYLTLDHQFNNLHMTAGIRGEYLNSNYSQNGENLYRRKDFTLYPSVEFIYTFNPNFILLGGYESKSGNPSFSQLSPIIRYINAMLYEKGNPELKLMNSHNIYLTFILNNKLTIEANYYNKKNFSMYVFQTNPQVDGSLVNSPININSTYYTLSTSYSDKWGIYRFAYNAAFLYDVTRLTFLEEKNNSFLPRITLSTVNQFDVYKQTMLFCNFNISSKYRSLGTEMKPSYALTLGLTKNFFKDNRLQVTIAANDILHKAIANSTTNINNIRSQRLLNQDSRNATISVVYNLNNFKNVFKKDNGNLEEINRITNR